MSATATSITTASTVSPRVPKIDFSPVNPNNIGTLRKLNQVLFPIKYSEKFYTDVLLPQHEDYCLLVYYNDIPVGTICCRIEKEPSSSELGRLYIMTMGVLAPYRSRKVGSKALQRVIDAAVAHNKTITNTPPKDAPPHKKKLDYFYMHVQTSNDEARRFYERHGFSEVGRVDGYYKKLEPHDAWILEKKVTAESGSSDSKAT
ncbi:hypothetical protein FRB94_002147 [Tulasnella sp. JGI-2019a]|nr:hypothetical protein FRB93_009084 [Tulasnella sp. JGI-2019a]KAG9013553.1 hypothetical protein FRB94_002147 [Tulasnella sp. JGI-2019a]KAG9037181.1 hypothetical protein FRB95_006434 [Tulasnella sp. JGI-2019a]